MRNFFLAVVICAVALGFGTTVYSFPSVGSDCTQCHGGGNGNGTISSSSWGFSVSWNLGETAGGGGGGGGGGGAGAGGGGGCGGGGASDGGDATPGCGSHSGCNRTLSAENQDSEIGGAVEGPLATEVTEEDGLTLIHPSNLNPADQVIIYKKELTRENQLKLEKVASWGVVVAVPDQGLNPDDCTALLHYLNDDSTSKFFDKLDMDSIIVFE